MNSIVLLNTHGLNALRIIQVKKKKVSKYLKAHLLDPSIKP